MDFGAICHRSKIEPGFFKARLKAQLAAIRLRGQETNAIIRHYAQDESVIDQLSRGPLFGLTFTVKDSIAVAGQPMTAGLKPPLQACCDSEAPIVSTLKKLGALLIGSTNLDELCLGATGYNLNYGKVINPKFPKISPLGSSSGAAAAVAAGFCDFALGSDFGGSVRLPAAACGICGLKFSPGLLERAGILLIDDLMDGPGILADSLDDIFFIAQTLLQKSVKPIERIRFLVPAQAELNDLPEAIRRTFAGALEQIGRLFEIRAVSADISFKELNSARRFVVAETIHNKTQSLKLPPSLYPAALRAIMLLFQNTLSAELGPAKKRIVDMRERIESALNDDWLILTPALGAMPPAWDESSMIPKVAASTWQFTTLANMCGIPAVVFAPFGNNTPECFLQLIGGAGVDLQLMEAAKKLAAILQGCDKAP